MSKSARLEKVGRATSLNVDEEALQINTFGGCSSVGRASDHANENGVFVTPQPARASRWFVTPEVSTLGGRLSTPLPQLKASYSAHMRRMRRTPSTIQRWMRELDAFVEWVADTPLWEIRARDIELGYLAQLESSFIERNDREMSAATMRCTIQALKSFYAFLDTYDFLEGPEGLFRNPMAKIYTPQVEQRQISWLQADEDETLLLSPKNARERIVLFLYRFTGVRLDEGLSLSMRDVNVDTETVSVLGRSKTAGGWGREIPMSPELLPSVRQWVTWTQEKDLYRIDGPFLVTRNHTEMKPQQIQMMINRMAERASLERRVTPHTLRRTFGSDLINRDPPVRLEVVSKLLGHSSTVVTERAYAKLLDNTIRREMMSALR